jgi:DnaK suppressor protein
VVGVSTEQPGQPSGPRPASAVPPADLVAVGRALAAVEATLDEVERALVRVDAGTYGSCERCGAELPDHQLAARPLAHSCLPSCPA